MILSINTFLKPCVRNWLPTVLYSFIGAKDILSVCSFLP